MKIQILIPILTVALTLNSCQTKEDKLYNGLPLIVAEHETIDYKIGEDWFNGDWNIAPQIENDTLQVVCHSPEVEFVFRTDKDSIQYQIRPGSIERFYVLLKDSSYAHTIIQGIPFKSQEIEFETKAKTDKIHIKYQKEKSEYLDSLGDEYPLGDLLKTTKTDTEKVLSILNWTNSRWDHNGNISPKKNDAISILKEAEEGGRFPCFAYAIVLRDQLTVLGYKARTVYLKTRDAKDRQTSPGHVATEAYLNDLDKWVFLDPQFNIMPTLNNVPLNAIEFQNAVTNKYDELELMSKNKVISKNNYITFVYDYLFYFDISLDNRHEVNQRHTIDGKTSLMLVPIGAENLSRINFWDSDIDYCVYTNSIMDFYASPE